MDHDLNITDTALARLTATCSPQVELMLVAAMLAAPAPSPGHYSCLDHPIARAARSWFTPCASHPAVIATRKLFYVENAGGFACDALTSFIFRRGEPPTLQARFPYSQAVLERAGGESQLLDQLAKGLRSF